MSWAASLLNRIMSRRKRWKDGLKSWSLFANNPERPFSEDHSVVVPLSRDTESDMLDGSDLIPSLLNHWHILG